LEEALEMTRRNGERYYQAELYRVKGELLLMRARAGGLAAHEGSAVAKGGSGVVNAKRSAVAHAPGSRIAETNRAAVAEVNGSGVAEVECCFKQSIEVAREQQAKAWELRAVTSLGRLYQSQGRGSDARNILAPVYSGFSEGFDTVDLREAKALLDELA
jgi:predicted ATPase